MKITSLDIETTGLDPDWCQILEIGVVLEDLERDASVADLPRFHCYVLHDRIIGEAYALSMHAEILRRIATKEKGYNYYRPEEVVDNILSFMEGKGHTVMDEKMQPRILFAGKNVGSFDIQFCRKLPGWGRIKALHRYLDPGSRFATLGSMCPPSLDGCLKMSGIPKTVGHTAVDDAIMVIEVLRASFQQ